VEAVAWAALSALLYFYLMLLQLYIFPQQQQTADSAADLQHRKCMVLK